MARVLLGVTGGIAAYKACELTRLLVKAGYEVTPVLTPDAERFVAAQTFEALARREQPRELYPHLVDADLLVIAPLSANTLAKLAHGLADNVLTQLALAFRGPTLVAPAMNVRMWEHAATQANGALLRERRVDLIGPEAGELAEGETGPGRMSEPEAIFARCQELLAQPLSRLRDRRVLVTAGGTREPLDLVRFAAPTGVDVVETPTAADIAREARTHANADVVLMAAAVADYAPEETAGKRVKNTLPWEVTLRPTEDVLGLLSAARTNGQILVGFGAEEGEEGLARKRRMLDEKGLDLVVFNDVSRGDIGFDSADNEVVLVSAAGERAVAKASKERIAAAILDEVERLLPR